MTRVEAPGSVEGQGRAGQGEDGAERPGADHLCDEGGALGRAVAAAQGAESAGLQHEPADTHHHRQHGDRHQVRRQGVRLGRPAQGERQEL